MKKPAGLVGLRPTKKIRPNRGGKMEKSRKPSAFQANPPYAKPSRQPQVWHQHSKGNPNIFGLARSNLKKTDS